MRQQLVEAVHPSGGALEALEDGVCTLDSAWRVTCWNAAAERLVRARRDAVLGRVLWDAIPYLRQGPTWDELQLVARDGLPRRFLEATPPGRGRGYLSIYCAAVDGGGYLLQFRDATEEVKREEQYAALLESIRDGFIAVDEDWNVVYLNALAESLLRFPRDYALGVSLWSLLPREPASIRQCLRDTMEDGIQRHLKEVRPAGRVFRGRVFDVWTYPLAGGGISILFEDVSKRVQRERELARYAAESEEANRAKSRFFAAVSHELRTPLNAIVGYTHLLSTGTYGELAEPAARAAARVGTCAEHLARLVDDILVLTTTEIGRLPVSLVRVDLAEFLASAAEAHRQQAEAKGLTFEVVTAGVSAIETDPQRLRQLLFAVLSNAVKFTSRGGIRVEALAGESPQTVEIRVSDTGPGIGPEDRERIFWAFEQLGDPARSQSMSRGSGLGLTIARQLASLLRGELFLAQTSPAGSCFCLRLPVSLTVPR